MTELFKRKANRLGVLFAGLGIVPVACSVLDDKPRFITRKPRRIGDDAFVMVEGQARRVRLLKSNGSHGRRFLVDMGKAGSVL